MRYQVQTEAEAKIASLLEMVAYRRRTGGGGLTHKERDQLIYWTIESKVEKNKAQQALSLLIGQLA